MRYFLVERVKISFLPFPAGFSPKTLVKGVFPGLEKISPCILTKFLRLSAIIKGTFNLEYSTGKYEGGGPSMRQNKRLPDSVLFNLIPALAIILAAQLNINLFVSDF